MTQTMTLKRTLVWVALAFLVAIGLAKYMPSATAQKAIKNDIALPEFTQTSPDAWINSAPLVKEDLKGKVVLLDIWTFDCWNCYRSFPWLNELEARWQDDLQVIGIHTPEFDHEKIRSNVVKKAKEFDLHHPIMMDNDFGYWRKLNNNYWPAYYLVDKKGHLRYLFVGETHAGSKQAKAIEAAIRTLVDEPA